MATRSSIAIKTEDGIKSIYCHWDGYVDHNGKILNQFYSTSIMVNALMDLGDLSTLGTELGNVHPFDRDFEQPELPLTDTWCMAYGRDRGEKDCEAKVHTDAQAWVEARAESWCEYFYLWDGQDWLVSDGKKDSSGFPIFDYIEVKILQEIVN